MDDLGDFFSLIGGEKKKEKEKTKEIMGEVSLGDLFTSLNEEKKRAKQKLIEKEEKLKKDAQIFENIFFDKPQEPVKTDDWKQWKSDVEDYCEEVFNGMKEVLDKIVSEAT